ncbi:CHAT domain-containing protein [Streptomyces sp. CA-249302]|uniref:CHAT domain-containing protein n=1 Tax=Streptomyces sp. CA-249302 TaxID=3240058 RepID=UPI003D8F08A4
MVTFCLAIPDSQNGQYREISPGERSGQEEFGGQDVRVLGGMQPRDDFIPCHEVDQAVTADLRTLRIVGNDLQSRCTALGNLAISLYSRYRCRSDRRDLDAAIEHLRTVLRLLPTGHREQGAAQGNLAMMLAARRGHEDLEDAVGLWRASISRVRPGSPDWAVAAGQLGQGLYELFTLTSKAETLDEAEALLEGATRVLRSVRTAPSSAPAGFMDTLLGNHAVVLMTRHQIVRPDPEGLDRSIALLDDLVKRANGSRDSERADWATTHLAQALVLRYTDRGDPADLSRAAGPGKAADGLLRNTDDAPSGEFITPGSRVAATKAIGSDISATVALFEYVADARQADVDQSIHDQRNALGRCGDDPVRLGMLVINLALTLTARHHARRGSAQGGTTDLTQALELLREHVDDSAPAQYKAAAVALRGMLLLERHVADPEHHAGDVIAAEELLRQALDHPGLDYRSRSAVLLRLAYCRLIHGRSTGEPSALNTAADTARRSVEEFPADSPLGAAASGCLADILLVRAELTGLPEHQREATEESRRICRESGALDRMATFLAARGWFASAWRRGALDEVAEAGRTALGLLHDITALQLGRDDKSVSLRQAEGLAAGTAFALAATGAAGAAAAALETGRAVMLTEVMQREHPDLLRLLSSEYRNLSARFRDAADELAALERSLLTEQQGLPMVDARRETYRERLRVWDDVVRDIRRLPGYASFLYPPAEQDLSAVAEVCRNTLVYLASTDRGGIAVIVPAGDTGDGRIRAVQLPALTPEFEQNAVTALRRAVECDDLDRAEQSMDRLCDGLWTSVMAPVVGAVGEQTPTVLIPGGLLGLLPLHAAARTDPKTPTGRRHVIDDLPIAMAPSARTLGVAVARTHRSEVNRLLAVRDPEPCAEPPLPGAVTEIQRVRSALPPLTQVRELHGLAATRQEVRQGLRSADICHFACHAHAGLDRPLDGGLSLASGERLTVRDMLAMPSITARLAVLSACDSGYVDESLPEEVVGLAAGFMQAGFGAVIAAQWPVEDAPAAAQMALTYRYWLREGASLPAAVARAMAWLRDSTNEEKHRAFPDLADFQPRAPMTSGDRQWVGLREHSSPLVWAAFGCVGI